MRISKLVGERTKETPSGVVAKSHEFLLRAGFIKQVCNGVFSLMMPAMRVQKKIAQIIREEMDKVEGQEVLFPVLMPRELWDASGRYSAIGNEMFRLKDRSGHDMVLGMTHEEAAVHMANNLVKSYDQLPFMIYQIQTKLRDEPRARAGLIRVREFTMKDAYSFHQTQEDLEKYYWRMYEAYNNVFKRLGMRHFTAVESDSGMMGGKKSHEFMMITDIGEDSLAICPNGDYSANFEIAKSVLPKQQNIERPLQTVDTGKNQTIEEVAAFFGVDKSQTCKAVVYYGISTQKYYVVFLRGDLNLNAVKLRNLVGEEVVPTDDLSQTNLVKGYIGPVGLEGNNIVVLFDISLQGERNLVVGANKQNFHISGFSFERDIKVDKFHDLYEVQSGHFCPKCGGTISVERGVEIGQIFQLGTHYTQSMGMTVHSNDGKDFNPIMGCYGIGVGRAIACIAEESSDEKGLVWPVAVAPWHVYLAPLRLDDQNVCKTAENLYSQLTNAGFEVIYDDRNVSAGVKFADSELMGIPLRIVVSPRSLENNQCEIVVRKTGEKHMVDLSQVEQEIATLLENIK